MKKLWLRICSMLLIIALTVNLLPLSAMAEEFISDDATWEEELEDPQMMEEYLVEDYEETYEEANIVEEQIEGRTEYSKEFLMDNGTSLAVVYDSAVHYEKNGQWEEIDNTLQVKTNGTYTNKAGVWDVSFPQQMDGNKQIRITKDGYTLSFGMAGELRQHGNLEVMSNGEDNGNDTFSNSSSAITSDETGNDEAALEANVPEMGDAVVATPEEITEEETVLQESEPEENASMEAIPAESIPEETISGNNVTEQDSALATTSIMVDGTEQTFAVSSVGTASGQIQNIDREEALAEAAHAETVLEKPVSQLLYADVYTNTDIQYDLIGNQVKESVILEAYSSTLRGYRYTLNTGGMIPVLSEDGSIQFYDNNMENMVMVMPAPYLEDNNHVHCEDIQVDLTGNNGAYTLTYILPRQWLAAEERAWPVILDPVISASLSIYNIRDKTVGSKQSYSYTSGINEVGVGLTNGVQRCYVKYRTLPTLSSADVIIDAQIQMYKPYATSTVVGPVEVHKVNSTWESETMTWSNKPGYNANVEDYVIGDASGYYMWDITDIVRSWYAGENTGMMFKVPDATEANTSTASWMQFYSSDYGSDPYKPTLYIVFRNNNGLEGYWDYSTYGAGRAGTGYVNKYTGNLVWVHDDIGFGGNRMPVSISHVYNANDIKTEDTTLPDFGMGSGWRTNYNQRVYPWGANTNYYVWEDGDGTAHYFLYSSSGTYKDEDGLELTLKVSNNTNPEYCITDKYGNTSYFDTKGRLTKKENNQATKSNNTITYTTTDGYLISRITDGVGRKYNFTYSSGLLSKITCVSNADTQITSISYGYTSGKLTSVTYKDGKKSYFTYGSKDLLATAKDIDGYTVSFGFNTTATDQPSRVSSVNESHNGVQGGSVNIEYTRNKTVFTDHNGNTQILQFNNMGNTISVQDGEGRAQYAAYLKNDPRESGKGNQVKTASKLQNTVANLLVNNNFEWTSTWEKTSNNVTASMISGNSYQGNRSVKITNSASSGADGIEMSFAVKANETYTFSAYVKTLATSAYLAIRNGNEIVTSEVLPSGSSWTRLQVSYTATANGNVSAQLMVNSSGAVNGSKSAYIDCAQIEKAATASRYNLVDNGDFRTTQYWSGATRVDMASTSEGAIGSAAPQLDNYGCKLVGNPQGLVRVNQNIQISGNKDDVFVVSGWARGYSVPLTSGARRFGIVVNFMNDTGVVNTEIVNFNPSVQEWQYSARAVIAGGAYTYIKVQLAYDYNANTAYFDGIQLYKEEYGHSYTYDDDGNVTSVTDLQKKTEYEYQNNNLTKEMIDENVKMTYEYDNYHNVTKATTANNVVYSFTYDQYGNNTSVTVTNNGVSLKSIANYSTDGNRLLSTKDATGHLTRYGYNERTNVLNWVQYPEDTTSTRTSYTYDNMYRMVAAAATTDTGLALSASYTYTNDNLTKLQTGSTTYNFGYGNFALRSNVKIGSRTLASYSYTSRNNYLQTLAYGNGDSVQYTYDKQGRVTKQTYEDGDIVSYRYDNNGALASVADSGSGITTTYYYDFIDRMMKYTETGGSYNNSVAYAYDTLNNLTQVLQTVQGREYNTVYAYDDDNRVTSINTGAAGRQYTYDAYGRVSQKTTKHGSSTVKTDSFTFKAPSGTTTSAQVSSHTVDAASYDKTYTYTYDNNGNILSVSDGSKTTSYVYDSANQLTRENNQAAGKTWTWTYDNAGNILAKKEYAYTTGTLGTVQKTVNYAYGDSSWGDLLTSHDGKAISYDTIGNPLSDGTWNYTWEHGRELASMSNGSATWNFTYNADGLRTKRTNGSTTYNYTYVGDRLSYMTVGSDRIYFIYDAEGIPIAARWNDANYYYVSNIQGDIVAIVNSTGTAVVEYTYDAWGNIISTTGSMASTLGTLNPLRYRAYVYDQETSLYYLQSRYYNPKTGRFLNADAFAATGYGILCNNMFAYCCNNPVVNFDPSGNRPVCVADGYRFVGAGLQCELNVGSYEVGLEIIVYTDDLVCGGEEPKVAIYIYEGVFVDLDDLKKGVDFIETLEKLTLAVSSNIVDEKNTEALLIALQTAIFEDISVSGSVVGIWGNEEFQNIESYSGPFTTYSGNIGHFKGSVSISSSCFTIAVGGTTSMDKFGLAFGQSNYTRIY